MKLTAEDYAVLKAKLAATILSGMVPEFQDRGTQRNMEDRAESAIRYAESIMAKVGLQ